MTITTNKAKGASDLVKQTGIIKNLNELSNMTGVSRHTLGSWYTKSPKMFRLLLKGAMMEKSIKAAYGIDRLTNEVDDIEPSIN